MSLIHILSEYAANVDAVLQAIWREERPAIDEAGRMLADSLAADGMLYVFGCGHSHMIEEELFYRAGGLGAVCPLFESSIMLHEGAAKSSKIERMSGYAQLVIDRYDIGPKDCFLAVSSSGINPFIIEMAQLAREKGAKVVGISAFGYKAKPSRHKDVYKRQMLNSCASGVSVVNIDNGFGAGYLASMKMCIRDRSR